MHAEMHSRMQQQAPYFHYACSQCACYAGILAATLSLASPAHALLMPCLSPCTPPHAPPPMQLDFTSARRLLVDTKIDALKKKHVPQVITILRDTATLEEALKVGDRQAGRQAGGCMDACMSV